MLSISTVSYVIRAFLLGWLLGSLGVTTFIIMAILTAIAYQFRDKTTRYLGECLAPLINRVIERCCDDHTRITADDITRNLFITGRIFNLETWLIQRGVLLSHIYDLYSNLDTFSHATLIPNVETQPLILESVTDSLPSSTKSSNPISETSSELPTDTDLFMIDDEIDIPVSKPKPKAKVGKVEEIPILTKPKVKAVLTKSPPLIQPPRKRG